MLSRHLTSSTQVQGISCSHIAEPTRVYHVYHAWLLDVNKFDFIEIPSGDETLRAKSVEILTRSLRSDIFRPDQKVFLNWVYQSFSASFVISNDDSYHFNALMKNVFLFFNLIESSKSVYQQVQFNMSLYRFYNWIKTRWTARGKTEGHISNIFRKRIQSRKYTKLKCYRCDVCRFDCCFFSVDYASCQHKYIVLISMYKFLYYRLYNLHAYFSQEIIVCSMHVRAHEIFAEIVNLPNATSG